MSHKNNNLRLARYSDIPRISRILADSFCEEELNQRIFPYRHQHYADFVRAWRFKCEERWWDYSRVFVVSTATFSENDDYDEDSESEKSVAVAKSKGHEVITGVAEWQRVGLGWERLWRSWGWWDPRRLVRPIIKFFTSLQYRIFGNRSMVRPSPEDPTPLTKFNFEALVWPFMAHHFTSVPYRQNHWELATLGVDPEYQGRGVGRELVRWGLQKAKEEDLPAVVVGAKGTEQFYERCGFEFLVGYATEGVNEKGEMNPLRLRGIVGGCIRWTRVKEDREKVEVIERPVLVANGNL
jgi:predicted GNAT family acetyltransferase